MIDLLAQLFTTPQILGMGIVLIIAVLIAGAVETFTAEWNRWSRYYRYPRGKK